MIRQLLLGHRGDDAQRGREHPALPGRRGVPLIRLRRLQRGGHPVRALGSAAVAEMCNIKNWPDGCQSEGGLARKGSQSQALMTG